MYIETQKVIQKRTTYEFLCHCFWLQFRRSYENIKKGFS